MTARKQGKWTEDETLKLTELAYRSANKDEMIEAFPARSWSAISNQLYKIRLARPDIPLTRRPFTAADICCLIHEFNAGKLLKHIAYETDRSIDVVKMTVVRLRREGRITGYRQPRHGQQKIGVTA